MLSPLAAESILLSLTMLSPYASRPEIRLTHNAVTLAHRLVDGVHLYLFCHLIELYLFCHSHLAAPRGRTKNVKPIGQSASTHNAVTLSIPILPLRNRGLTQKAVTLREALSGPAGYLVCCPSKSASCDA